VETGYNRKAAAEASEGAVREGLVALLHGGYELR
jgi:hypothetical protein